MTSIHRVPLAFITVSVLSILSCSMQKVKPGLSLRDIPWLIPPELVHKGNAYYLRYQIDTTKREGRYRFPLFTGIIGDRAYYYFVAATDFVQSGSVIEHPVDTDGFTDYARVGKLYWMNQDKSDIQLVVKEE